MNVELQQLPVFENGEQVDRVWIGIVADTVIDRPNHSRSVKATKEFIRKLDIAASCNFSIHTECQDEQRKKARKE